MSNEHDEIQNQLKNIRDEIRQLVDITWELRCEASNQSSKDYSKETISEIDVNFDLSIRAFEDSRMRLGKVIQNFLVKNEIELHPFIIELNKDDELFVKIKDVRNHALSIEKSIRYNMEEIESIWNSFNPPVDYLDDTIRHFKLSINEIENAQMRLGKVLQHFSGGVSCYDK